MSDSLPHATLWWRTTLGQRKGVFTLDFASYCRSWQERQNSHSGRVVYTSLIIAATSRVESTSFSPKSVNTCSENPSRREKSFSQELSQHLGPVLFLSENSYRNTTPHCFQITISMYLRTPNCVTLCLKFQRVIVFASGLLCHAQFPITKNNLITTI